MTPALELRGLSKSFALRAGLFSKTRLHDAVKAVDLSL